MNEDSAPKPPRKRYANAGSMHVAAALNDLYRFKTAQAAGQALEKIKRQFTTSSQFAPETGIALWIRDYEVTEEETEQGYLGHFAQISVLELPDGLYTLRAGKHGVDLKFHPVRQRKASRCPNWGHPILRSVLKGKQYPTLAAAEAELTALHLEYPETTVPGINKLYLMIFSRRDSPKNPIERYVLEIKNEQGGGFTIQSAKNTFKRKSVTVPTATEDAAPAPMGHFASLVALKQKKKKS